MTNSERTTPDIPNAASTPSAASPNSDQAGDTAELGTSKVATRSNRPAWQRWTKRLALYLLIYQVAMFSLQRFVLYPGTRLDTPPMPHMVGLETFTIPHDQGQTTAFFLSPTGSFASSQANGAGDRATVVFFHGNGELVDHRLQDLALYTQQGLSVLAVEYRGYGHSEGRPNEAHLVADTVAAIKEAANRGLLNPQRLLFHGQSIGGGVASAVAAALPENQRPKAFVLESSFTSVPDMTWRFGVLPFLALDKYDTNAFLGTYQGPVLITHGREDSVIPASSAEANAATASNATLKLYDDVGHNNGWHTAFQNDVRAFVQHCRQIGALPAL